MGYYFGGGGRWGIILVGWGWVEKYFGRVGMSEDG